MRLSLKKKIILLFMLVMILMVAFFATYFYKSTSEIMAESEHNLETIVTSAIAQETALKTSALQLMRQIVLRRQ